MEAHEEACAKMKEVSKSIARRSRYTYADEYAEQVRANKKAWFKEHGHNLHSK